MPMLASIIMPCRNEEKYIREALQTAFNNDLSPESFEVIVVDGCSTDRTGEILNELKEEHTHLQVLENPKQTVPYAMNMGIRAAQGEFVIRIDAHCEYPRNYFSELIKYHRELNAGNVGTVMESRAKHSSRKTESIARVLSDGLGVGNAFFRIGADEIREVDTVPFGCYRREIFKEIGLYDERLTKSQDFELNRRLKRHGSKIYLLPHLHIVYYVRDTLLKLFQKYYKNGMWNIIAIKYTGRVGNVALRNYVPFLFVLANILGVVGSVLSLPVLIAYLSGLGAYLLTILWRSVRIRTPRTSVFWTFLSFLTLHFSHGIGGLVGLLRFPFIKQDHHRAP